MSREKPARKGKLGYETEKKVPKDCNYKWQLEGLYEKFGKCLEYDVAFTITNDLQRLKDAHKMEQLQGENQRQGQAAGQREGEGSHPHGDPEEGKREV